MAYFSSKKLKQNENGEISFGSGSAVGFTKTMKGYNTNEVDGYIRELQKNNEDVKKVLEDRCAEYRDEIELLSCEMKSFKDQCEKYKEIVSTFQQTEKSLRSEIARLKDKPSVQLQTGKTKNKDKFAGELKNEISEMKKGYAELEQKYLSELENSSKAIQTVLEHLENAKKEIRSEIDN